MQIRSATQFDVESIVAFDHVARDAHDGEDRLQFIRESISKNIAYVAEIDDQIVGHMVFDHSFFRRGFISMVYIHPDHRRKGMAATLIGHAEGICDSGRIFTSTNRSNRPMKALLRKLGYVNSGMVDHLDPGDPEVFYSKNVRPSSTPHFPNWDRDAVLHEIERRCGVEDRKVASRIMDWGDEHFSRSYGGTGRKTGSITFSYVVPKQWYSIARIKTTGTIEVCFQHLAYRPPFDDPEVRKELLRRVNEIPGVEFPDHLIGARPRTPLNVLGKEENMAIFCDAMERVIGEIRKYWEEKNLPYIVTDGEGSCP